LASFDFHSSVHRKNPLGAIAAFAQAFPRGEEDVQLVVKSSNGTYYPGQLAELVEAADGDPRILIRDQVLDASHMRSLQRCCDAYVSLHRAEGFGLGLAECMAMGKPVVATAWSGNLDFMGARNSCLVDAVLVPVQPHEYPNAVGARWAEPDLAQAAAWMRRLASEPDLAARIGAEAAQDVRDLLSPQRVAEQLVARVQDALRATGMTAAGFPAMEQRA
jgi:glycosyltransferase involved in cell wall biosynthesis